MTQKIVEEKVKVLEEFIAKARLHINEFSDYSDYPAIKRLFFELESKISIIDAIYQFNKFNQSS